MGRTYARGERSVHIMSARQSYQGADVNTRRLAFVLILVLAAALAISYTYFRFFNVGQQLTYRNISVSDAKAMMESNPSLSIVDVRTIQEFAQGHLKGAVNIPLSDLPLRSGELEKNKPILVYCHTGNRSAQASAILVKAGFTHIYNMEGGISAWTNSGYPTVTP
jgi:rhodanese-related sulfurtransferase